MASDVIGRDCATARFVDVGKVLDHRLVFTRQSVSRRGSAADIVTAPDMVTWGAVYEVSDDDVRALDRREGHPNAYERSEIDVELMGAPRTTRRCVTYTVVDKVWPETKPQPDYFADILCGAAERNLPSSYQRFLESLAAQPDDKFRHGYVILPTKQVDRRTLGVLQVSPSDKSALRLGDVAFVEVGERRCVVRVLIDDGLQAGEECRLDQNVRDAIGVPGQETFGATATLDPCDNRTVRWSFIRPRFLVLPVNTPARLDSEKNIAVLHPKNIRLLGLNEGDYVRLRTAVIGAGGRRVTKSLTIRTFGGSITDRQARGRASESDYPKLDTIYVDADGRHLLGLAEDERGTPIVVTADIPKLFLSRTLFYGLTYFVGIAGLAATTRVALDWRRAGDSSDALVYLISAAVAALLTAGLAVVDIRSRVQS